MNLKKFTIRSLTPVMLNLTKQKNGMNYELHCDMSIVHSASRINKSSSNCQTPVKVHESYCEKTQEKLPMICNTLKNAENKFYIFSNILISKKIPHRLKKASVIQNRAETYTKENMPDTRFKVIITHKKKT